MSAGPPPSWRAGDLVAELAISPISRATLALYAGASGDHNPLHIDLDAARAAGFDDVFVHGMLVMAYLGRCLTEAVDQRRIKRFSGRFLAVTNVGDVLHCTAQVKAVEGPVATLELKVIAGGSEIKFAGEADVDIA